MQGSTAAVARSPTCHRDPGRERGSLAARVALVALVVSTALSVAWTARPYWEPKPDAARYLLAAQSLLEGRGYTVMGEPFRLRPPGFSTLLVPTLALRGIDFTALNATVSLLGVAAVALFFVLFRPVLGTALALVASVVLWSTWRFQLLCNLLLSDVPSLAFVLAALLAIRWSRERSSWRRDVVVALAIAAAAYVRSSNLVLLPAFVLDRLLAYRGVAGRERGPAGFVARRVLPVVVLASALYLPWAVQERPEGRYSQEALHSYLTAFLHADPLDPSSPLVGPGDVVRRLSASVPGYIALIGSGLDRRRPTPLTAALGTLAVAGLLFSAWRHRSATEWFALGTLALLLGYFTVATRLALPVFALALGSLLGSLRWLGTRRLPAPAVDAVLVAGLLLFGWSNFRVHFMPPGGAERFREMQQVASFLRAVPASAALAADNGAALAVLVERPLYSLQTACNKRGAAAARDALLRWDVTTVAVRKNGPCAELVPLAAEQRDFGSWVVLRGFDRARGAAAQDSSEETDVVPRTTSSS